MKSARELAVDILERSICSVKVGAAIEDRHGIFSWGWNSVGDGYGIHAECHAIRRASRLRLPYSIIYVASVRNRNGKAINSMPCDECMRLIRKYKMLAFWRDADRSWK